MIVMKEVAIPLGIIVIVIILHPLRLETIKQVKPHQREVQPHHIVLVAVHIVLEQAKRDTPIVVVITVILLAMEVIKIRMAIAIATNLGKMIEKVDTAAHHQKMTVHMTITEAVLKVAIRIIMGMIP